jgi:hypothetical protein
VNRLVVAVDTGREMAAAIRPVLAAVRRLTGSVELCGLGDPRCHLMTFDETLHVCGMDRSLELALYVYARVRRMDQGMLLLCGTGGMRDAIAVGHIRHVGGLDRDPVYTSEVLRELRARVTVRMLYLRRGVYDTGASEWETLLGASNVAVLDDPRRVGRAMRLLITRRESHGTKGR